MPTGPLTPEPTPTKPATVKLFIKRKLPDTPLLSPIQPKKGRKSTYLPSYKCENTGNDHPNNHLRLAELMELSVQLAKSFQPLYAGEINSTESNRTDTLLAQRLLQRDVVVYCRRIATNSTSVQCNTILRALTLFALRGIY